MTELLCWKVHTGASAVIAEREEKSYVRCRKSLLHVWETQRDKCREELSAGQEVLREWLLIDGQLLNKLTVSLKVDHVTKPQWIRFLGQLCALFTVFFWFSFLPFLHLSLSLCCPLLSSFFHNILFILSASISLPSVLSLLLSRYRSSFLLFLYLLSSCFSIFSVFLPVTVSHHLTAPAPHSPLLLFLSSSLFCVCLHLNCAAFFFSFPLSVMIVYISL